MILNNSENVARPTSRGLLLAFRMTLASPITRGRSVDTGRLDCLGHDERYMGQLYPFRSN